MKRLRPVVAVRFVLLSLLPLSACKGPSQDPRAVPLEIPEQGALAVQWQDGPRQENAEFELERAAKRTVAKLFPGEPMPSGVRASEEAPASGAESAGAVPLAVVAPDPEHPSVVGAADKPSWADGVQKPADAAEGDMPRAWPVEVKRGETPALLAEWAGTDPKAIFADNAEALRRKWLKTGDRVQITMSPNQKVAFDRKRESYQRERVDAFFSRRYFERVVVYRVKKGEYVAAAAKRFGDVPLWLIEEFNQTDFRGLQPGDEILIPIVATLEPGQDAPPPLSVVDEEGRPLGDGMSDVVQARLKNEFISRARMALDDSNVFMRATPDGGLQPMLPGREAELPSNMAAGMPRPLPAAAIGGGTRAANPLLPDYRGGPGGDVAYVAGDRGRGFGGVGGHSEVRDVGVPQGPALPEAAVASAAEDARGSVAPRDVVVKRGESLMHYVQWSKASLNSIKGANPHLDPNRIFVGARVAIPMSDEQYASFVKTRGQWDKDRLEGADKGTKGGDKKGGKKGGKDDKKGDKHVAADGGKKGDDKAAAKGAAGGAASVTDADAAPAKPVMAKAVKVKVGPGDTATTIARAHKISVKALKNANPKVNLKRLKRGTVLVIPAANR